MPAADALAGDVVHGMQCAECGARFGADGVFCPFDGVRLTPSRWDTTPYLPSRLVDDRYELLEVLGEGGMGTVYKVRHVTLDRLFAMKVLRLDLAKDAELARRFLQEAKATAAIKHPAVVAITDFGSMEDGTPYFVMEHLDGETLRSRIRSRGPLPPEVALRVARRIAEGVQASHDANVIHRDLKPENVFLLGPDGAGDGSSSSSVRIVDFGAAKVVGASKLTRPGIVFGTPYYMSPEQAGGQEIDARADVYSLGVLLYEMLTGRVPFEADTYMGVLTKHMFEEPARPTPPAGVELGSLEGIVLRALAKDPSSRFASMTELARALEAAERECARVAPPVVRAAAALAPSVTSTADRIEASVSRHVEAEARRTRWTILLAASAICTAVVVSAVFLAAWFRTRAAEDEPHADDLTSGRVVPVSSLTSAPVPPVEEPPETAGEPEPTPEPPPAVSVTASDAPPTTSTPPRRVSPAATSAGRSSATVASPASAPAGSSPRPKAVTHGADDFKDPWK